jgi:DNA mismatch endonuclease (patch repair protein)
MPRTRADYWKAKLARNVERDKENLSALRKAGWQAYVIWECELPKLALRPKRLFDFLGAPRFYCGFAPKRKRAA